MNYRLFIASAKWIGSGVAYLASFRLRTGRTDSKKSNDSEAVECRLTVKCDAGMEIPGQS